jgi:hypothetical protein
MVNFTCRGFRKLLNTVAQKLYLEVSVIIGISISFYSCALYSPNPNDISVVKTCSVPSDQSGTISGHWSNTPIPIAFHQGDFTTAEMLAMTNAADVWNKFYNASQGHAVFDYGGTPASPRLSSSADTSQGGALCASGILQGGTFSGNVVLYKLGSWPYAASAIALTSFCTIASKPLPNLYMALLEVNYQGFFVQGTGKYPDLFSIILHELGHLLGLNHSCEGFTKSGTPSCNDSSLNPDYSLASMFPSFGFDQTGAGQVKQSLGNNDESRANCLYTSVTAGTTTPTTTTH